MRTDQFYELVAYSVYTPSLNRIFVSTDGTAEEIDCVYLHEVGRWAIKQQRISVTDEEQVCNDVAFILQDRIGTSIYSLI